MINNQRDHINSNQNNIPNNGHDCKFQKKDSNEFSKGSKHSSD